MRVRSVRLKGIGPFQDTVLELPEGGNPRLADTYLLVGQNGCGKTTALHAIATALAPEFTQHLQTHRRFAWPGEVRVRSESAAWLLASSRTVPGSADREAELRAAAIPGGSVLRNDSAAYGFGPAKELAWGGWLNAMRGDARVEWGLFTYAGSRGLREVHISAITDARFNGLRDALAFEATVEASRLAQWIANQDYRRMKLRDGGQAEKAEQVKESISRIEGAISEIIQAAFSFHLTADRLTPAVRVDGTVLDFGMLPDGLKSIVSWVSDLLMRLDETPWVNDTPVLERSFLLARWGSRSRPGPT